MASSSDIAFSSSVKAAQERRGSRSSYARMEEKGGFATAIDQPLADFIAGVRSFYLATANKDGQPYIQHRGGPPGFLRVLDAKTIAFAEFSGNRQYITTGNLADNPRAMMFLMDYANRRRVKIWGTAARHRERPQAHRAVSFRRLPGARRSRDPVQRRGLGRESPATHSANAIRRGRRGNDAFARRAHRTARVRNAKLRATSFD